MIGYRAFLKKEFVEFYRSHKLLIILAVFLLLGMMNPLTAKLTPQLMESFMPQDIVVKLAEPSALDSWMQFYKNVPQLGLVVLVILFSGMMSQEYSKGTLINMLTKGLPRWSVILSKFTLALIMWTAAFALCALVSWGYTAYFWQGESLPNILFAASMLWLYGVVLLAACMLAGAVCRNAYGNLLMTGGFVAIQFLLNLFPGAARYNPLYLASGNLALIQGGAETGDFLIPAMAALCLTLLFLLGAVAVFNKKAL